jgi:hypothetical protein
MDPRLKVVNHVIVLLREAFDVMEQIRNAPESPVTSYLPAKLRRTFRRNAERLLSGKLQSKYRNVLSSLDLATVYRRTADRDDTIERGLKKLRRILAEVERVEKYQAAELEEGMRLVYQLACQRAQEDGPGSKAADFLNLFQEMIIRGSELRTLVRRNKKAEPPPEDLFRLPGADPAQELHWAIIAAEVLGGPPDTGEPVLRFASPTMDAAEPLIMRIGLGDKAWVGSFPCGTTGYTTVQLMPGGAHLLVVAGGAGYFVEAVTRFAAGEAGNDITDVLIDEDAGLLILDRSDVYFEAYGTSGPLWTTGRIGSGAIRNLELRAEGISGETRQGSDDEWIDFFVALDTGEVTWRPKM